MRAVRWFAIPLACAAMACAAASQAADATASTFVPPHADALQLVLAQAADRIRDLDGSDNAWFDTKTRTWSVTRPFAPGRFDSRNWLDVSYAIDGRVVATWSVDLGKRSVQENPPPRQDKTSP